LVAVLGAPVEAGRLLYATNGGGYTPVEIKVDDRSAVPRISLLSDIIDASGLPGILCLAPA